MNTLATHDAWLVFAGYMQSREARDARKRYWRWRRANASERVQIAAACARGEMSATIALGLLNDTMYYD